jgi:SAM-dependent methyltransferase
MEASLIEAILDVEDHHWWFQGRRKIVARVLESGIGACRGRVLEIGCGSGANFKVLEKFGGISAIELDGASREAANHRKITKVIDGYLPDGIDMPDNAFELVALLDVLEHIEDDEGALARINRLLKPGGHTIITVPAFQFIWSHHDDLNHHFRRYTRKGLVQKVSAAGMQVCYSTYANCLLFPFVLAGRLVSRCLPPPKNVKIKSPPSAFNSILEGIFGGERHLMPALHFPFGSSVLVLAKKDD